MKDFADFTFKSPGRCIFCLSTEKLTNEHIIQKALGGNKTLQNASCEKCARITGKIEQLIFRGSMWQVRVYRDMPSRTKHRDAPKTKSITVTRKDGTIDEVHVGFAEAPILFTMPLFTMPASLEPKGYVKGIRMIGQAGYQFGPDPQGVLSDLKAQSMNVKMTIHATEFARVIAKLAYVIAVAQVGVEHFVTKPFVIPAILGETDDIGRWVGTLPKPFESHKGHLHRVDFEYVKDVLVATVQLFADMLSPRYVVILGHTVKAL